MDPLLSWAEPHMNLTWDHRRPPEGNPPDGLLPVKRRPPAPSRARRHLRRLRGRFVFAEEKRRMYVSGLSSDPPFAKSFNF